MTLPLALSIKLFERIISLLLYFQKLVHDYQIFKIISALYISIKLFYNKIIIPIALIYPRILILIELIYFKILIFIEFFYFRIPILIQFFQILNCPNAQTFQDK